MMQLGLNPATTSIVSGLTYMISRGMHEEED